jgi:hypothetical protein
MSLEKLMWRIMQHVGAGTLSRTEQGSVVYNAPCPCGNENCGDELVLSPDRDCLIWTRWWGDTHFYDRWAFYPDGDYDYIGTALDEGEGFRYPPVVPE